MTAKKCTTKCDARAKLLFFLVELLLFLLSCHRRILNFLLFTIHCDPSETEFSQCKLNCIRNVFPLIGSSFVWLGKLGERTAQLWRDNSCRVRTHEKNSGETVCWLGTIIQSIFCAQSGASIRLTVWKWSCESQYPLGASTRTWRLSSRRFSWPDWPPLGLWGWLWIKPCFSDF